MQHQTKGCRKYWAPLSVIIDNVRESSNYNIQSSSKCGFAEKEMQALHYLLFIELSFFFVMVATFSAINLAVHLCIDLHFAVQACNDLTEMVREWVLFGNILANVGYNIILCA